MRSFGFAMTLLALPASATAQDAPVPFILTGLGLDLRLDYPNRRLGGTATLTVRNLGDAPVAEVPLLLGRLMRVTRAEAAGETVPVSQDVVLFTDDSTRQVNAVTVTLPRPVAPGDSASLALTYAGHLVGYTETGSLYIRDRVDSAFTILREDALAFPVLGRPSLRVYRSVPRGAFRFEATVAVPPGQVVAMGGVPAGTRRADGLEAWTWRSREPVPFLNITIAPYRVLERGGVRIYHFPGDSAGARRVDQAIAAAVARLGAWYGPLGDGPRLTVMEIPEGWGSQASLAAGIIQTADAFRDPGQLPQLYHELSHLWNVPDLDPPSPRWNEGLASFLQWRLAGELDGWTGWPGLLERVRAALLSRCEREPRCATAAPDTWGREALTDLSYRTGLLFFRVLYEVIGAESFDRAYRSFLETQPAGGTTALLAAAFERADPRCRQIFTDWMRTPGWYHRLRSGESLAAMVERYRTPRAD